MIERSDSQTTLHFDGNYSSDICLAAGAQRNSRPPCSALLLAECGAGIPKESGKSAGKPVCSSVFSNFSPFTTLSDGTGHSDLCHIFTKYLHNRCIEAMYRSPLALTIVNGQ